MTLNKKNVLYLGTTSFSILGILSLYFYKERTVFLDLAYILFKVIQTNSLAIQVNRFVSVFTHGVVQASIQFNLSLSSISQLFSLSFVVFQFILFLIILKIIKDEKLALGLLLFNFVMPTHTFFWTASELIQGMAFVFVFFALLNRKYTREIKKTMVNHFLLLTTLITASFAHPLLNIPLAFGLMFFAIKFRSEMKTSFLYFFILITINLVKQKYFSNDYDVAAASGVQNFIKLFPNYYTPSFKDFLGFLKTDYKVLSIIILGVLGFYSWYKQYTKALLVAIFFVGYASLINITYPDKAHQFYLESQYLALSFFAILPFVLDILPHFQTKSWPVYLIVLICLLGIVRIINASSIYTERLNWNRNLLAKCDRANLDKVILLDKDLPKDTLKLTWGLSYECWLLSTIEQSNTKSIIAVRNEKQFDKDLNRTNVFLSLWNKTEYQNLNPQYFKLRDQNRNYNKFEYGELATAQSNVQLE